MGAFWLVNYLDTDTWPYDAYLNTDFAIGNGSDSSNLTIGAIPELNNAIIICWTVLYHSGIWSFLESKPVFMTVLGEPSIGACLW